MQSSLEDTVLTGSMEEFAAAVESTLDSEHLEGLRQWFDNRSNITWLTDNDFLGAFATLSTDDYTEAQNRLQGLLISRKKNAQWFENLDSSDPKILEVFNQGWLLLLPDRDDNGKQLNIVRFGLDADKIDTLSWIRALGVFCDYLFLIDYKDKSGTVSILDFDGATSDSYSALMSLEDISNWCQIVANYYPHQLTDIHYIRCSEDVKETIAEAMKSSFSLQSLQNKIHSDTVEELYKDVPMRCLPLEYLPADYTGPNAGTLQQIIEYTKSILTSPEVRDRIYKISHDQWNVNESQQTTCGSL